MKAIKTLLNIIYMCMKNMTFEEFQTNEKLLLQIGVYLGTDLSHKSRDRELMFVDIILT